MTDSQLAQLLNDCRRGSQAAQRSFYERYYGYALSVCLVYANDREDAREILNDGFMKALNKLESLQQESALRAWLRRIMVNTALDYYRVRRRRELLLTALPAGEEPLEPYLNEEQILATLSAEDIIRLLQELPLPYRLVFSLYVLDGYSHQEIAGQLGLAVSTSRAHLSEANRRLRLALTDQAKPTHEPTRR
ncbi:RNA polymerase sigma factor [Spirosoma agri]|uniref:Sigma-70 family RNA polymerase sigma factor n=1 Tax=Spirosoma agri TaxID=1987381 RepID=A0A6M0IR28_9BACT|nr:sigma-70 family RNA polymerase sigma factor [Spirosoma agri]NEU70769.1 sigma-70 family RNA polymerase sigma factor [Spirosoma agri]